MKTIIIILLVLYVFHLRTLYVASVEEAKPEKEIWYKIKRSAVIIADGLKKIINKQ